ncbi:protein kinase [Nocardiopsis sp. HNM0947]|uniref:Protein kinase n=2 Tax=Nocardiopsis coralli TaxID=2772213 RepID=A0ABR9PBY6_9ACTN|nr:protein kinase [Nocardiopsis coralli]
MGQVYLARTPGDRPIVVKVVRSEFAHDEEFRRRFAQEVEAAQRVGGFHTAQVVDADIEADPPWVATAHIPAPSLEQVLQDQGPLGSSALESLFSGLAEGLEAIHACGLVHRDLKPGNVLMAEDGPRIIDFGIARALDAGSATVTGQVIGTLAYMSPEQVQEHSVGPASDVFSLGTVMATAATGSNPFDAATMAATVLRIISPAPSVETLPARLRPLVEACWQNDPKLRPTPHEIVTSFEGENTARPLVGSETAFSSARSERQEMDTTEVQASPPFGKTKVAPPKVTAGARHGRSLRLFLLVAASAVLIASSIHWAFLSEDDDSVPEFTPDTVIDLHEGLREDVDEDRVHHDISAADLSPDADLLATADSVHVRRGITREEAHDYYARLLDSETGEEVVVRQGGEDPAFIDVTFTSEGDPIGLQRTPEVHRLWDISTGEALLTLDSQEESIGTLDSRPESTDFLTDGSDGDLHLWDGSSGERIDTFSTEGRLNSPLFSPDGSTLATGSGTGVLLWDVDTGAITTIDLEEGGGGPMAFSADGELFATAPRDDHVHLWDAVSGELETRIPTYTDSFYTRNFGDPEAIRSLTFSPDGSLLATGQDDSNVRLWDISNGTHTSTLVGRDERSLTSVFFGVGGETLISSDSARSVQMWTLP